MKATGIARRIDNLGRVVIPKEIRRTIRIRESDPLHITSIKCHRKDKSCGIFSILYLSAVYVLNHSGIFCIILFSDTAMIM
ncbi:MAG: AbrB/MazE/SpoVT family DNA-binding domain-containing protein [Ruminococcus sp.]|nr:AbrB/MazE/SpoVT family DNA-binding domain-containing protein [Ruminococcus sp.]